MLYPFSNRFSYFLTRSGEKVVTSVTPLEPSCVSCCDLGSTTIALGLKGYFPVMFISVATEQLLSSDMDGTLIGVLLTTSTPHSDNSLLAGIDGQLVDPICIIALLLAPFKMSVK